MSIFSLVPYGNGACVIHSILSEKLLGYQLKYINPVEASFPRLLFRHQTDADILHSLPDIGPWAVKKQQKYVVTFHNYYLDSFVRRFASFYQYFFYQTALRDAVVNSVKRANHITTVSTFLADIILQEFKGISNKITVIKNGVDESLFYPLSEDKDDEIKILFAGNPTARKGKDVLLSVAKELPPNSFIQYTGDLRYDYRLPNIDGLKLLPSRPHNEMPSLYQGSDVLFFPSYREGQGLVILEAMASGLPVVTTNLRPMSDFITHGRGGYLFEAGNYLEALMYLKRLIQSKALRSEMGEYNRDIVLRKYRQEKMISEYNCLFNNLK